MRALCRLGGVRTVPRFIALLDDPSWEIRQNAWLGLCAMTAQDWAVTNKAAWVKWWSDSTPAQKEQKLLAIASRTGAGAPVSASADFRASRSAIREVSSPFNFRSAVRSSATNSAGAISSWRSLLTISSSRMK